MNALLAALILASPAAARPTPEKAVASTLIRMRAALRYDPERPAPRGPHEWDARKTLAAGTVNGCVGSAKAFFALFSQAHPGLKALYIDSFDAVADGGHAVVEVAGADGRTLLVDAAAFEKLPATPTLDEAALASAVDIRPRVKGRILQAEGRADLFAHKQGGKYLLTEYPYGQVFDGRPKSQRSFSSLKALNAALADLLAPKGVDLRFLEDNGLLLSYVDAEKTAFLYPGAKGLSRHVVYGCADRLPAKDDAEAVEPGAREIYRKTGKVATCDRSRLTP